MKTLKRITVNEIVPKELAADYKIRNQIIEGLKSRMDILTKDCVVVPDKDDDINDEYVINRYIDATYEISENGEKIWQEGDNVEISFRRIIEEDI